jgi:2-polyprenyl-6-methoxyphenol hydroxylase-like FAD-dependent oxidoreductase
MTAVRSALVVGGGIAGMSAAAALARAGVETTLLEISPKGQRPGTGISLLGNALRALDQLSLADECIQQGFGYDSVEQLDSAGRSLRRQPIPRFFRPERPACAGIRRAKLSEIFEEGAQRAGVDIRHEVTVAALRQDRQSVYATLTDGQETRTDVLVIADGVYSKTRAMAFNNAHTPEYIGQGGWRLTVPRPADLDGFKLFIAEHNLTVGVLPLSADCCYFFYLENTATKPRIVADQMDRCFAQRMEPFEAPMIRGAVDAMRREHELSYRPFDILLMPHPWHNGRVVLIGDAAHSLTPQLTSGGGMALEDAVVLAEAVAGSDDVDTALNAYSERRYSRVQQVFNNSLQICRLAQGDRDTKQASVDVLRASYGLLAQSY